MKMLYQVRSAGTQDPMLLTRFAYSVRLDMRHSETQRTFRGSEVDCVSPTTHRSSLALSSGSRKSPIFLRFFMLVAPFRHADLSLSKAGCSCPAPSPCTRST